MKAMCVGNLPVVTTEDKIRQLFSQYGRHRARDNLLIGKNRIYQPVKQQ